MPKRTDIKSILIIGAGIVTGCATRTLVSQTKLDQIAVMCNLPKGSAIDHSKNVVELKIPHDANFDNVGCLLDKLKAAGINKIGFVGNEQLRDKEGQK